MYVLSAAPLYQQFFNQFSSLSDPRNQEAISLLEEVLSGEPSDGGAPGVPGQPFQLYELTPYLKSYLFYRRNKYLVWAAGGAAVIGVMALSYKAGRIKERKSRS